ncbi:DUF2500 domain-containing protein [Bacillus sp. CGMCC 1.16607]|uniref:DUF2500 domain-containing protein n=1 Tax=Bacillus sp. CGMCC 1.16607 TaxID=3351842 RepID=UPI0036360957
MGFDPMFSFFQTIFPFFFIFVFGMILFQLFRGVKQWNYNNHQPVLTVNSKVVSKRTHVSRHSHNNNNHIHHHSSTSYYLTFEFESGDRLEFMVKDHDYGQIVEGDYGHLTFQGTRYLSFERQKHMSNTLKNL